MLWFRCLLSTSKDSGVDGSQFIQSALRICQKKRYPNFLLLRTTPDQKSTLLESSKTARPREASSHQKFFMEPNPDHNAPLNKLRSSYEILRFFRGPWTVGYCWRFLGHCWILWDVFIPMIRHKTGRFKSAPEIVFC